LIIFVVELCCMWWTNKKYDIDFSDENIDDLSKACDSLCEFFSENEEWDSMVYIDEIKKAALDYDFNRFRNAAGHHALVGGMNSLNDIGFEKAEKENEFKKRYKTLIEKIIQIGFKHPNLVKIHKRL